MWKIERDFHSVRRRKRACGLALVVASVALVAPVAAGGETLFVNRSHAARVPRPHDARLVRSPFDPSARTAILIRLLTLPPARRTPLDPSARTKALEAFLQAAKAS